MCSTEMFFPKIGLVFYVGISEIKSVGETQILIFIFLNQVEFQICPTIVWLNEFNQVVFI